METIQLYPFSKPFFKVLVVIFILLACFGTIGLILGLMHHSESADSTNLIGAVMFLSLGLTFSSLNYLNYQKSKCFVSWDEKKLSFRLPEQKKVQTFALADLVSIHINYQTIFLKTKSNSYLLSLKDVQLAKVWKITAKFEELKQTINQQPT